MALKSLLSRASIFFPNKTEFLSRIQPLHSLASQSLPVIRVHSRIELESSMGERSFFAVLSTSQKRSRQHCGRSSSDKRAVGFWLTIAPDIWGHSSVRNGSFVCRGEAKN
ncbi:hypothetical protein NPIL_450521 [Nephila pilipes]|uniref:Uncharacterized protein n=1 Tax=Nephila pilipes TaxID=299642 RepID=A0A8X6NEG0_NEPPI|nr:hypothetical protein NPIL_450521 [Nephila pilipes]